MTGSSPQVACNGSCVTLVSLLGHKAAESRNCSFISPCNTFFIDSVSRAFTQHVYRVPPSLLVTGTQRNPSSRPWSRPVQLDRQARTRTTATQRCDASAGACARCSGNAEQCSLQIKFTSDCGTLSASLIRVFITSEVLKSVNYYYFGIVDTNSAKRPRHRCRPLTLLGGAHPRPGSVPRRRSGFYA